jgi:hypothetical protein
MLEQCIAETNNDPWYRRLYVRSLCNGNWISNSQEAWITYAGCMGISGIVSVFKP